MAQSLATLVSVLVILVSVPSFAQSSPADGPWFGQIQCQVDLQQQGYERHETQTWKLTSNMPVGKNGDMQLYSASWTVTGQGGFQRAMGQRASLAQWNINVPPANATVAMFVRASDRQFIIRIWQRPLPSYTGINAMRQVAENGVAQPPARISSTVQEWALPWIAVNPAANTTGKLLVPVESLGADLTPPGSSPAANCTWQFSRTASTVADEQAITNARTTNDYTTSLQQSWTGQQKSAGNAGTAAAGNQSSGAGGGAAAGASSSNPGAAGGGAAGAGAVGDSGAAAGAAAKGAASGATGGAAGGAGVSGADTSGAATASKGGSEAGAAGGAAAGAGTNAAAGTAGNSGAGDGKAAGAVTGSGAGAPAGAQGTAPIADVTGAQATPNIAATGAKIPTASTTGSTVGPTSKAVPPDAKATKQLAAGSAAALKTQLSPPLWGWADLHTHPMSNLAFGGKLFHGAPDVGSLMPAVQMPYDPQCRFDNRAISMEEALSDDAPTHGDAFQSKCGDSVRNALIQVLEVANDAMHQPGHAIGAPTFGNWPRWNDITHQKMWVDWIKRAHDGGLRVMVALSHNNRLLGEAMGAGGPISGNKDDVSSSDLQVAEIKAFVGRHNDFLELAKTSADLYRIVQAGKLAIVLGVEVDNMGNFIQQPALTAAMVDAEIGRLYAQGVRYVIPVHLIDNVFGDTALYSPLFDVANFRENNRFWTVGCAGAGDLITFQSFNFPPELNAFIPPGVPQPPRAPACPNGHINGRTPGGLTTLGQFAVKAMMKRGMIIDVDHMSNAAVETALQIAWDATPAGYPMMSGHSAVRDGNEFGRENSRTPAQLEKIACLGGMFGVGTDGAEAYQWAREYTSAYSAMTHAFSSGGKCPDRAPLGPGSVAFGTDTNSLVSTPRPTMVEFKSAPRYSSVYDAVPSNTDNPKLPVLPRGTTGSRTWDYNMDGVAHYGMYAEFVRDVRMGPSQQGMTGKDLVDNHLLSNADYFYRMWQKAEAQATNVH